MSFGHSEVSFNHSCLKVPVDSLSRRPAPTYERSSSGKNSQIQEKQDKKEYYLSDLCSSSVKKYLEFYESIPDYSELHHLSNEEFYSRLKSLKITQKRLTGESGNWSAVNSEDCVCNGKFNCDTFTSQNKEKSKKEETKVYNYNESSPYGLAEFRDKKSTNEVVKQPPPKINIISDNENNSDLYEPECKKLSDYEADRESSTLQIGDKSPNKFERNVEDELENCSRRSRSLPISPGCECESLGLCRGFSDISFRNNGRHSSYSFPKDNSSIIKKPKKTNARPIPLTSRIPLFDKIMMEKEARRKVIHDLYSEELRSIVKPFSFTKREEERERLRLTSSNPELNSLHPRYVRFKAKPIPKNLFSNYAYEKMKEDEFYRALKKRIRAEEMLKSSSLPPSMALREKKFRSRSLDYLDCPKRCSSKLCGYTELEGKSESSQKRKHKSNNRRICSATDSSTEISPYESVFNREKRRKGRSYSALSCSRNNLASVLRIETARKRLEKEMEEKMRENRLKDQARFKAHLARMNPAWGALRYDKNEDLALRMAARRKEERLKRENHQKQMESMYGRVYNMPPLFHRERFFSNSHNCSGEKDSEEKREKDDKMSFGNQENRRSQESSECEKNVTYESDET